MNNTIKLLNAFPLAAMWPAFAVVEISRVSWNWLRAVKERRGFESYIGHKPLVDLLKREAGIEVELNRAEARIECGDQLVIIVLKRRLPPGATDVEVDRYDVDLFYARVHCSYCDYCDLALRGCT